MNIKSVVEVLKHNKKEILKRALIIGGGIGLTVLAVNQIAKSGVDGIDEEDEYIEVEPEQEFDGESNETE